MAFNVLIVTSDNFFTYLVHVPRVYQAEQTALQSQDKVPYTCSGKCNECN